MASARPEEDMLVVGLKSDIGIIRGEPFVISMRERRAEESTWMGAIESYLYRAQERGTDRD